jgi:SAM-dependent methyltransferase
MAEFEMIDGFKCYSPKLAISNNGFSADSFSFLRQVEENNFWFKVRNRVLIGLIKKYSGKSGNKKLLEIGCGTGYVLSGLSSSTDFQLSGSDIHVEGLKYAQQRVPTAEFIQMDATEMPFENEFDAIGAFDVLEHISEDELALKNIHKSLCQDGVLYISVPQYMFMWSSLDEISFHKRRYSKTELIQKVTTAGFKVEYCGSFVFSLFPLMVVSRFLLQRKEKEASGNEEFKINKFLNAALESVLSLDEFLIKSKIRLPFGGSLLCVARKTDFKKPL